jgi:hypothetical protein
LLTTLLIKQLIEMEGGGEFSGGIRTKDVNELAVFEVVIDVVGQLTDSLAGKFGPRV